MDWPIARAGLEELVLGLRLATRMPGYLRRPLTLAESRARLRQRQEHRPADLLALLDRAISARRNHPYQALLRAAGLELGDIERLVGAEGVEGALTALACAGVYLTVDEFKGRKPVRRGSTTFELDPRALRNPAVAPHLFGRTSGSRGERTPVPIDLEFIRERAVDTGLVLETRGGARLVHATWEVPGGSALGRLLWLSGFGNRPARWFSQVDPTAPALHPRYRRSARVLRAASILAGRPLPRPEFVSLDAPQPIVEWVRHVLEAGRLPMLHTFPSAAVRACRVAHEAGVDLRGAQFAVVGEPMTAARLAAIRQVGAEAMPVYGSAEAGRLGYGCQAPIAPDDVHVLDDLVALIQPGTLDPALLPSKAVLVTALRPSAPLVLLNVSLGDQAEMERRACGCPLGHLGWTTHLHTIRSYEKVTAGGMSFLDVDVIRVLEEALPARFGGGPTDYQLIEEETADGTPRVLLRVHPGVGAQDSEQIAAAFLDAIGTRSAANRVMALQWGEAGWLRVERRPPAAAASGKILHLHQNRRPAGV
jgi:hypothetical protein